MRAELPENIEQVTQISVLLTGSVIADPAAFVNPAMPAAATSETKPPGPF